jgi:hypothetical protein
MPTQRKTDVHIHVCCQGWSEPAREVRDIKLTQAGPLAALSVGADGAVVWTNVTTFNRRKCMGPTLAEGTLTPRGVKGTGGLDMLRH